MNEDESQLQSIAAASAMPAGPLPAPALAGPLRVSVLEETLRDEARARDIPLRVYLPEGAGPFPLIVFSHGLGSSRAGYPQLAQSWASHGYAVALPTHAGSDGAIFQKLRSPTAVMRAALADTKNWEDRPRDVSCVLDALAQARRGLAALEGKLDLARVGVGGHSFGAWTCAAVAGARIIFPGESAARPLADPRPRAFLAMSPTVYGERGQSDGSWASIARPFLAMTGTEDHPLAGGNYELRTRPFRDLPPADKWLVVIAGAEHLTFSGGRPFKKVSPAMERVIEEASLAFWDAELNGDARAKALLQPAALEREGIRVQVETR